MEGPQTFWFASVRPKRAGKFGVRWTVKLGDAEAKPDDKGPREGHYELFFRVGEADTPRVFSVIRRSGSPVAWAFNNVGDTLVLPIHLHRNRSGHVFAAVDPKDRFLSDPSTLKEPPVLDHGDKPHVARNDASEFVQLRASQGQSVTNRPGTGHGHYLGSQLEFTKVGEFNLAGCLADEIDKLRDSGIPIRVAQRKDPVSAVPTYCSYWKGDQPLYRDICYFDQAQVAEARVGDRITLPCGEYYTEGPKPPQYRLGALIALPFHPPWEKKPQ